MQHHATHRTLEAEPPSLYDGTSTLHSNKHCDSFQHLFLVARTPSHNRARSNPLEKVIHKKQYAGPFTQKGPRSIGAIDSPNRSHYRSLHWSSCSFLRDKRRRSTDAKLHQRAVTISSTLDTQLLRNQLTYLDLMSRVYVSRFPCPDRQRRWS